MLIEITNLTKTYRAGGEIKTVFDGYDFSLGEGEFLAIKGRSGCGKSTFLRILGLMDGFDSGEFKFRDKDVKRLNDKAISKIRCRDIGFVFQNFNLIPEYTILENLEIPLGYAGVRTKDRRRRCSETLARFGLSDALYSYPNRLSGGQQQRAAIARALINEPSLILADEPTGNLDSENTKSVMALFSELHKSGITVVVVTHDELTASYAERVISLGNRY